MSDPVRLVGNLVAVIGVILAVAYLIDHVWLWFGGTPWAFCGLFPVLTILAHTVTLVMVVVGMIAFLFSGGRNGAAGILILGGLVVGMAPSLIGGYLGGFCGGG